MKKEFYIKKLEEAGNNFYNEAMNYNKALELYFGKEEYKQIKTRDLIGLATEWYNILLKAAPYLNEEEFEEKMQEWNEEVGNYTNYTTFNKILKILDLE